jgi:hypothetical protein
MLTIRAMSDGTGYSARHLQHSDYYAEGERVTGQWQGRGAEMLGLAGEVQSEQFEALRQGLDPKAASFSGNATAPTALPLMARLRAGVETSTTSRYRLRSQFPSWPSWVGTLD